MLTITREHGFQRALNELLPRIKPSDLIDEEWCLHVQARLSNHPRRLPEARDDRDFMEVHRVGGVVEHKHKHDERADNDADGAIHGLLTFPSCRGLFFLL